MAYTNDWIVTDNPADHSKFKNIPSYVRKVRTDVEERLKNMLYGFTSGETDEGFKYAQFKDQAGNPSTPSAGFVRLFMKAIGSLMRLHYIDQNAMVAEISTESKGADTASAATTDLSAATGRYIVITGTTTITGLGTAAAGVVRKVKFAGILTLTHNATSLILPTAANITTAADDRAEFMSLGSGNWICLFYQRADGSALAASAYTHPSGSIQMWAGALASPPAGYLVCDGSAVSRTTYSALFAVISTTFGTGDGSTTFNLPNMTNRFPYGANEGSSAGNASVGKGNANPGGGAGVAGNDNSVTYKVPKVNNAGDSGAQTQAVDDTVNLIPPYIAVGFIIKT